MEDKKFSFLLWFARDIELIELQESLNKGNVHEVISRCFHYYLLSKYFCHFATFCN